MLVPQYWAESRLQKRTHERQVTVRRFGWSDDSQEAAQAHADQRAQEALERLLRGERLPRREEKAPYNGADGLPIREEIVSRHGDAVVTRNSYGARCLNTPNVLFADLDFSHDPPVALVVLLLLTALVAAVAVGWFSQSWLLGAALVFAALVLSNFVATRLYRMVLWARGGPEAVARRRIACFLAQHPHWNLRLYRTPAGLRVLAMHQTFQPEDAEVTACFQALGTDPIYARMCRNQQCFRARVSPKPWRIGIGDHLRPQPGIWPVAPERLPLRTQWIERYEAAAQSYAACSFLESLGSGTIHPEARAIQELHDEMCQAARPLPIA